MQLSALISAVREDVQDPNSARWQDSTIIRFLNDAQLEMAKWSLQLQSWQTTISALQTYVAAPDDLLIPKYMFYEVNSIREPLKMRHGIPPESIMVTGYPEAVYIVGTSIFFYPVPNSDGTHIIVGTQRPTPMALAADTPTVQDADNLLIAYAAWQLLLADGDPLGSNREKYYNDRRREWAILDAQKNPMPTQIERNWYR